MASDSGSPSARAITAAAAAHHAKVTYEGEAKRNQTGVDDQVLGAAFNDMAQQVDTTHPRHHQIRHQQIKLACLEQTQSIGGVLTWRGGQLQQAFDHFLHL